MKEATPSIQSPFEKLDTSYNLLYKIGAIAAIVVVIVIPVQSFIYIAFPPPKTVLDFFTLFQQNPIKGLLDLDLLLIIMNLLMVLTYTAVCAALMRINKSLAILSLILSTIAIILVVVSREATFSMLFLSNQYAVAVSELQRNSLLTIGQTMLTIYNGSSFNISYVLAAFPMLIVSFLMYKSRLFTKATGVVGIIAALFMFVPPTVGMFGLIMSMLSLIPTIIWLIMVAKRLLQFTRYSAALKGN